ncbi:MAG: TIGR04283 family arsenosugar biosynthesis glycosyltransferase [Pseudomonadota bacterium]
MPAPISIIIPTLNAETELPGAIAALMEGLEAGLIRELIISDGGSSDGTMQIAEAAGAEWISGDPSRGGQLRRGAETARADWLLFLHADTQLAPGWTEAVSAHMAAGGAGYFWLRFRAVGIGAWQTARWANLRSRFFGLAYGDQGLLIRRTEYAAAGGYDDIPLMEDVAFARRLRLTPIGHIARTGAARYKKGGWYRRGASNLITLALYYAGVSPARLAARYRR